MSEELTKLQVRNIEDVAVKAFRTEKIVEHNLDLSEWEIDRLYKDTLWVKLLDEPDAHTIKQGALYIPAARTKGVYRFAQVLMCGDETKYAKAGEYVRFPSMGVGMPYEKIVDGYKTYLIRETDVVAVVKYVGDSTPEDDISQKVLLSNINNTGE